jgi:hypothetical protein
MSMALLNGVEPAYAAASAKYTDGTDMTPDMTLWGPLVPRELNQKMVNSQ